MNIALLPLAVWAQVTYGEVRSRVVDAWDRRDEETGLDEAVTKMVWLAVGIGVALAATAFFVDVFNSAKATVPDPVPAAP